MDIKERFVANSIAWKFRVRGPYLKDTQAEEQAIKNTQLRTARDAYDRQRAL